MDRKSGDESSESGDRQGTYYQFLIERKVPNGTIRHIASLINVTYEFIPDNFNKRQKIREDQEVIKAFNPKYKENSSLLSQLDTTHINGEMNALKNLELKRLEDKTTKVASFKELEVNRRHQSDFGVGTLKTFGFEEEEDGELLSIYKKASCPPMQKSKSHMSKESHLSFLKNQKLIP